MERDVRHDETRFQAVTIHTSSTYTQHNIFISYVLLCQTLASTATTQRHCTGKIQLLWRNHVEAHSDKGPFSLLNLPPDRPGSRPPLADRHNKLLRG